MSPASGGLCPSCVHVQRVESQKGSVFWLCRKGKDDPRFTKYPPQPVWACAGFEPRAAGEGGRDRPGDSAGDSGARDPLA